VRTIFFLLCAIPFWTSGIIRAIAWIPFFSDAMAHSTKR
jgi:ABC-type spermidine/putrescine transport system permease subunit I